MFLNPKNVIAQAGIGHDMNVADLGAGSGAYSFACSPYILSGAVYAVDIQKKLAEKLRSEIAEKKIKNIEVLSGDIARIGGTKLKDGSIDLAILSNVFCQIKDRETAIREVKRILKNNGRVLFLDWYSSFNGMGPHKDAIFSKDSAKEIFKKHGFKSFQNVDAGDFHYGIIFSYES